MRPAAWTLPRNHPDLCPHSHTGSFHREPYGSCHVCPGCGARVWSYSWPTEVGGGRLNAHYRPTLFNQEPSNV